jgi:peroxiredoxin
MMPMTRAVRALPLLGLALLLLGACSEEARSGMVAAGNPAPQYAAPLLGGDTVSLAALRGEVVVLNIWATWCPPCREEMPGLQALHDTYGAHGLRVLGVSIDNASAAPEVRRFLDENAISFTILHDADETVTRTFRTLGVPETFLIDREGQLVKRWTGKIDPMSESVRGPVREALGIQEEV